MVDNQVNHRANFRKQLAAGQIVDNSRRRHQSGAVSLPKQPVRPPVAPVTADGREPTLAERLGIPGIPRVEDIVPAPTLAPVEAAIPSDVWSAPTLTPTEDAEQQATEHSDVGVTTPTAITDAVVEESDMTTQQFESTPAEEPNTFTDMWNSSPETNNETDEDEDPLV